MGVLEDKELMPFWEAYQKRSMSLTNTRNLLYEFMEEHKSTFSIVADIYINPNSCKDIRDKLFGLGLGTMYDQCHRGCTPFAWVHCGQEKWVQLDMWAKAHDSVNHHSVADQERELQEGAASCPTSGLEVRVALAHYVCGGLMPIFGGNSNHQREVAAMV